VETACALFDLSHRGRLTLRGEDRVKFLNALVSNDVKSLLPGQGCHACLLSRQSKIQADLRIFAFADRLLLDLDPGRLQETRERLERYRIGEQVTFEEVTEETVLLSLQGPKSPEVVASLLSAEVAAKASELPPFGHMTLPWQGEPLTLLKVPRSGRAGFDLLRARNVSESLWGALTGLGAWASGHGVLETCRVEAGIPLFGADFTEETLFPEADLSEAVSYTKGCFVGQEVVARVRSRGHVNRRRTGLLVKGRASTGDSVFLGNVDLGPITSIAWSPRMGTHVAFAMLKGQPAEMAGQACMVKTPFGLETAVLSPYPFTAS